MPNAAEAQLEALADRLDGAEAAVRAEMRRLVTDAAELLLDINRGYLEAGYGVDGKQLSPNTYTPAYAAYKLKYGAKTGKAVQNKHVDLKLSEDFYNSFDLLPLGGLRFQPVATDAKYGFLQKYGELLGIREADLDDFVATLLKPDLESFLTTYLRP